MKVKRPYVSPELEEVRLNLSDVILYSPPIETAVPTEYHDIEDPTEIDLDDLG